jgi:hypothetical protein
MSDPVLSARTTTVLIYQGEDQSRLDELYADVERARLSGESNRLNDGDGHAEALSAYREAAADAEPRAIAVVVKALPRRKFRELVEAHPPREANDGDAMYGVNYVTFGDALVPPSIVAPEFTTDARRDEFVDNLSDADFTRVYRAAFALNRVPATDPKDLIAFEATRSSDET